MEMDNHTILFGCQESDLKEAIEASTQPYMGGHCMLAMSILSDAQELIIMGADDRARQMINRAKYVINDLDDTNNLHKD